MYLLNNVLSLKRSLKYFFVNRSHIIPHTLIESKVKIYNGKKLISNIIRSNMVNHKFGEFCLTKSIGSKIHIRKKNKKKTNKKK